MFCFRVKRKLYDYIEGKMSQSENLRVKSHLQRCLSCRKEYNQISIILGIAARKETPKMDERFWNEFQAQLDKKLSACSERPKPAPEIKFRYQPRLSLKPAFALAFALVLLLGIASYIFQIVPRGGDLRLAQADKELLNELILYEELEQVSLFLPDDESFLEEEIEFLYQLDPAFIL